MQVVHDGYNQSWFTNASHTGGAASPEAVISLIGRLAPWKGQHVFIEAAAQVLRQFPDVCFWIVGSPLFGEDEYEQRIRTQVNELGMEEAVKFLGFQEDIPSLLNRTDIVVHASTHGEPFGQVVVEGMAAGRPVVATDGGALPEIIEHGQTGLLVPMGDAPAMAQAMISLLADPAHAREMGLAGQRRVQDKFTLNETVRKVQTVYDCLLFSF
jgi:glycosyltransferase involved in cell wall biosynthesis